MSWEEDFARDDRDLTSIFLPQTHTQKKNLILLFSTRRMHGDAKLTHFPNWKDSLSFFSASCFSAKGFRLDDRQPKREPTATQNNNKSVGRDWLTGTA